MKFTYWIIPIALILIVVFVVWVLVAGAKELEGIRG